MTVQRTLIQVALPILTRTRHRCAGADLEIRTDLQRAVVARADPTLLASLIGNLLDNAVRHNVDGGRSTSRRAAAGRGRHS